ncbi:hypothetical protein [Prescottella equi]|uniref:hypothetical protein n=1 Tax=Rhodococcus hoagii TaxID=43767 RepID=UPI001EECD360|nr:hypothetical protein [Prescottella equi]
MNDTRILAVADQFHTDCQREHTDCRRERWDRVVSGVTVIVLGAMLGSMPWWELIA